MRIRWLGAEGICGGSLRTAGDSYDFDDAIGAELIERGLAAADHASEPPPLFSAKSFSKPAVAASEEN